MCPRSAVWLQCLANWGFTLFRTIVDVFQNVEGTSLYVVGMFKACFVSKVIS